MSGTNYSQTEVVHAAWLRDALRTATARPALMFPYSDEPPPSTLSATDIERIAVAVADELDRRAHSPLRVTSADVRRWLP